MSGLLLGIVLSVCIIIIIIIILTDNFNFSSYVASTDRMKSEGE
jgi:hypothetical protein